MISNELDRFRLIEKIVRDARLHFPDDARAPGKQSVVATRARVAVGTVNNVENITKSLEEHTGAGRSVSRRTLISVLLNGLRFDALRLDAILWLFDGQPMSRAEIELFQPHEQVNSGGDSFVQRPVSTDRYVDDEILRNAVLNQLRTIVNRTFETDGIRDGQVRMYSAEPTGRLASNTALLRLEELPGQMLTVSEVPSLVTFTPYLLDDDTGLCNRFKNPEYGLQASDVFRARARAFQERLSTYGRRSIHSWPGIQQYVLDQSIVSRTVRDLSLDQRRKHILYLADLLDNSDYKLEIGLVPETPDLELTLKTTVSGMVRGARNYEPGASIASWGPRYIQWLDSETVLHFYVDFESAWDQIRADDRTRGKVARRLREVAGV